MYIMFLDEENQRLIAKHVTREAYNARVKELGARPTIFASKKIAQEKCDIINNADKWFVERSGSGE